MTRVHVKSMAPAIMLSAVAMQAAAQLPVTDEVATELERLCPLEFRALEAQMPRDGISENVEALGDTAARVTPRDAIAEAMALQMFAMGSALDAMTWTSDGGSAWSDAPEDRVAVGSRWFVAATRLHDCLTAVAPQGVPEVSAFVCEKNVGRELDAALTAAAPTDELGAVFDKGAERCRRGMH
jgi:hypothetical protein